MLKDLEAELRTAVHSLSELFRCAGPFGQLGLKFTEQIYDAGGGFLACFDARLVVSVDIDEGGVEPDDPFI